MSKIICILNHQNPASSSKCLTALDYHSGWVRNFFSSSEVFIGCLDLPFRTRGESWIETADHVLAMDGEVLSPTGNRSHAAALLQLFLQHGENIVHHLNGSFTVVVWDRARKKLFIFTDRMGLRPLYFAMYSGKLFLASEIKAIVADPDFSARVNAAALIDLFSYEYVLGNDTLVHGIEVFPNASFAIVDLNHMQCKAQRYWDFQYSKEIDAPSSSRNEERIREFRRLLMQSVSRSVAGENGIGLLLSGGLDSRMIAGAIRDTGSSPKVESFTFGEPGSDDVRFARKISKAIKSKHHYTGVQPQRIPEFFQKAVFYQDGMANCNHCHYFHMLDQLSSTVQVALDGFVGDVLPRQMFGPWVHQEFEQVRTVFETIPSEIRNDIFLPTLKTEIANSKDRLHSLWQLSANASPHNPLDHFNLIQRQRKFINYGKISKRNHIEIRTPFTDNELMDFCLQLPREVRMKDRICKEMFFMFYPDLARIPQADGGSLRPGWLSPKFRKKVDRIKSRLGWKTSLMNYDRYYRTTLKDFARSVLTSRAFRNRGYFNPSRVENILEEHLSGRADRKTILGVLLTFELWCRFFLDQTLEIPAMKNRAE